MKERFINELLKIQRLEEEMECGEEADPRLVEKERELTQELFDKVEEEKPKQKKP